MKEQALMMDKKQINHGILESHTRAIMDGLKSSILRLLRKEAKNEVYIST